MCHYITRWSLAYVFCCRQLYSQYMCCVYILLCILYCSNWSYLYSYNCYSYIQTDVLYWYLPAYILVIETVYILSIANRRNLRKRRNSATSPGEPKPKLHKLCCQLCKQASDSISMRKANNTDQELYAAFLQSKWKPITTTVRDVYYYYFFIIIKSSNKQIRL